MTKYNPHHLVMNQEEVHKLVHHNVGRSVWAVYSCLCAFAGKKQTCFPSHRTIKAWLKADYAMETISRAITTLVKHGVIEKRERTSKERFKMTFRFIVQGIKGLVRTNRDNMSELSSKPLHDSSLNIHKEKNKNIYKHKRKRISKKKSISHWFDFGQNDESSKCDGELIFSRLVAISPTLAPTMLTEDEKLCLYADLSTKTKRNSDWFDWVKEAHGDKIPKLLKELSKNIGKKRNSTCIKLPTLHGS